MSEIEMQKPSKLMNRNFYLLWQGQTISALGAQLFAIATLFWVKHTTDSATLVGLMLMLSAAPAILLSPIGGAFADRHSRRKILIFCNLINGLGLLTLAGISYFAPEKNTLILVWLFLINILVGVVTAFFNPAFTASIPDVVASDRIMSANSLAMMTYQLAVFFGQGIGGTLYRILGATVLFLINSITYLFAFISNLFVSIPQQIPEASKDLQEEINRFKEDIIEGIRYVWQRKGLRNLVLASTCLTFFVVPILTLMPFFIEDTLKVSTDWYGYIVAADGLGAMLGFLIAGTLKFSGPVRGKIMITFMLLEAVGYGILSTVRTPVLALCMACLGGFIGGFVTIHITTLLQMHTPQEIRGRVFGLLTTISGAASPIAMGISGIVADLTGKNIPLVYLMCSLVMTVIMILISFNKDFRTYLSQPNIVEPSGALSTEASSAD
jgi:MFS transporter, DHA3 family, macrolide efflux protein